MVNTDWQKRAYTKALLFGILFIGLSIVLSADALIFESDLVEIKGKLRNAHVYISTVSNTHTKYGIQSTSTSQKAELIFGIVGQNQNYILSENIGKNLNDEKYNNLKKDLDNCDSISVWLKKADTANFNPEVFRIYGNAKPLLTLNSVRLKNINLSIFVFALGLGMIFLYAVGKYPTKIKALFSKDNKSA